MQNVRVVARAIVPVARVTVLFYVFRVDVGEESQSQHVRGVRDGNTDLNRYARIMVISRRNFWFHPLLLFQCL